MLARTGISGKREGVQMHGVRFVSDEDMPEDQDFLYVEVPHGAIFFLRESAISPSMLEDCWAAYRSLRRTPPVEPTRAPTSLRHLSEPFAYWRTYAHLVA